MGDGGETVLRLVHRLTKAFAAISFALLTICLGLATTVVMAEKGTPHPQPITPGTPGTTPKPLPKRTGWKCAVNPTPGRVQNWCFVNSQGRCVNYLHRHTAGNPQCMRRRLPSIYL